MGYKKLLSLKNLFGLLLCFSAMCFAQTKVNYTADDNLFANPERGFYHHTETHSTNYSSLNYNSLANYRTSENITLILRVFYLENFKTTEISDSYLSSIEADFIAIRKAGLKCIVRFSYNDDASQTDASKEIILKHIEQLEPILREYSDVIASVQAGFIGSWGEWYYTTQNEFGLPGSTPNYTNRGEVLNKLLDALPSSIMVQLRTPTFKREMFNESTALSAIDAHSGENIARVGHHNDCFLASSTDYGTYGNATVDKAYLGAECLYVVNGGETCAKSEYSGCDNALKDLANLHYSYLNIDYISTVLDDWESNGCFVDVEKNLGYRLTMSSAEFSEIVEQGQSLNYTINLSNDGWAAPFNPRGVELILRSKATDEVSSFELSDDPRFWLPGESASISGTIIIPKSIAVGEYDLLLNLPDTSLALKDNSFYSLRFANTGVWEATTGYNNLLAQVVIIEASVVTATQVAPSDSYSSFKLYSNLANDKFTIELSNVGVSNYKLFDINGKMRLFGALTSTHNIVDVSGLSNGVYLVSVDGKTNVMYKMDSSLRFNKSVF